MFEDRFNLTREQNIFLAKKLLVENIYHSAKVEGCNVTFPQTQTILDGVNVGSVTLDDIQVILNLRDAWKYLLNNVEKQLDVDFMCKINYHVSRNESLEWGVLRGGEVSVSGTNYIPVIPKRAIVIEELEDILRESTATARAIRYFMWGCRSQLFWDGNKRTSTLVANKIMISEGKGILSVREDNILEFNERLTEYYNTNDPSVMDQFLYDKCIKGLVFAREISETHDQDEENDEELER